MAKTAASSAVAPPASGSRFGRLVETAPPLPAKMGRRAAAKIPSSHHIVEPMTYVYVWVEKAADLPNSTIDNVTGAPLPYVEVKLGNFNGVTKHLDKNPNPEWRQTFAFSQKDLQPNDKQLEVVVKDKNRTEDQGFVGRVLFDMANDDIPVGRPPVSDWYRLELGSGEKLRHGKIMLAVWIGTQADEAFPGAWHSDAPLDTCRVYFRPKFSYLKVVAIRAKHVYPGGGSKSKDQGGGLLEPAVAQIKLGKQVHATCPAGQGSLTDPVWNKEFMFVVPEPLDDDDHKTLVVTVDPVGWRVTIPVAEVRHNDGLAQAQSVEFDKWFDLSRADDATTACAKIHLWLSLETAYHVLEESESTYYSSDLQPSAKKLHKPSIGTLELGILGAKILEPVKAKEGQRATAADPYCVAKFGSQWVRTRTVLNTLAPQWNEQYSWDVFDPCTALVVVVLDNGGKQKYHQRIGNKLRVPLSMLDNRRLYTHLYPLMMLTPGGLQKTGELHLAVRFTRTVTWPNMVRIYAKPQLPEMHYSHPISNSKRKLEKLRLHAVEMVAAKLGSVDPPLRQEVVEYVLDVESSNTSFSMRRTKANVDRFASPILGAVDVANWIDGVCKWEYHQWLATLLCVLCIAQMLFPHQILLAVFICCVLISAWILGSNYLWRPRKPPHTDTVLSHAEPHLVDAEELDEELDTFYSSRSDDVVRRRYNKLRSVGLGVERVFGNLATLWERAKALVSWRDFLATSIFTILYIVVSVVVFLVVFYGVPFRVVVGVLAIYLMRPPSFRFRSKQPSVLFNFYKRLPAKSHMLL